MAPDTSALSSLCVEALAACCSYLNRHIIHWTIAACNWGSGPSGFFQNAAAPAAATIAANNKAALSRNVSGGHLNHKGIASKKKRKKTVNEWDGGAGWEGLASDVNWTWRTERRGDINA